MPKTQHLVKKSHTSQRHSGMFLAHDPAHSKTRSWVSGVNLGVTFFCRSLYLHLWGRLGNAQQSADQARGMVRGYYSGYVKLSWANPGTLEIAQ